MTVKLSTIELITKCSMQADGNELVHLLCDRLTQCEMKLQRARHELKHIIEMLKCENT